MVAAFLSLRENPGGALPALLVLAELGGHLYLLLLKWFENVQLHCIRAGSDRAQPINNVLDYPGFSSLAVAAAFCLMCCSVLVCRASRLRCARTLGRGAVEMDKCPVFDHSRRLVSH